MWLIEIGFVFVVCQPFLEGGGNGGTSVWKEGVSHSSNILCYFETAVPCHCVRCWICWFNRHPFHSRLSISPLPVWCLVGVYDSELRRALAIMRYCVTLIRSCPRTTNTITSISVVWYAHSRQLIVWHPDHDIYVHHICPTIQRNNPESHNGNQLGLPLIHKFVLRYYWIIS